MTSNSSSPYGEYITVLRNTLASNSEARFAAEQLLRLHECASLHDSTVILELGVDRGQSTKVFLNAISQNENSHLVSVDIRDCSSISNSSNWTFVRDSSINIDQIVQAAPMINNGIDLLYIDSLHTPEHVKNEFYGWFPYLNNGCCVFFDDVDSGPYMKAQRKDNFQIEACNRNIMRLILSIFRSNINILDLQINYGSTGLACLTKRCDKSINLNDVDIVTDRNYNLWSRFINKISPRRSYQHALHDADSFLIDVTRYES